MCLRDWLDLDVLRRWYPGMDPMRNSHRRNMALFVKANPKNQDPGEISASMQQAADDAFRKLNEQIKAGMVPKL